MLVSHGQKTALPSHPVTGDNTIENNLILKPQRLEGLGQVHLALLVGCKDLTYILVISCDRIALMRDEASRALMPLKTVPLLHISPSIPDGGIRVHVSQAAVFSLYHIISSIV